MEIKLLQLVAVSDKKCGFFLCTISNPAPPSFLSSQPLLNHKALLRLLNSRIIPMEFLCMSSNIEKWARRTTWVHVHLHNSPKAEAFNFLLWGLCIATTVSILHAWAQWEAGHVMRLELWPGLHLFLFRNTPGDLLLDTHSFLELITVLTHAVELFVSHTHFKLSMCSSI